MFVKFFHVSLRGVQIPRTHAKAEWGGVGTRRQESPWTRWLASLAKPASSQFSVRQDLDT